MRILVVTLFAGENELEACLASVRRQTLQPAEHMVIRHLPKREAHEKMFSGFLARRDAFDLLVKVDADMVLCKDDLFAGIASRFEREPAMQVLGIKVHDFYTDRPMSGLNTFRNTVSWSPSGDVVFTDRFDMDPRGYRRDDRELAPAAMHCPDPGAFQAFHFGVHRGVKAAVATQRGLHETAYMRCRELAWTWRHCLRSNDPRLALATLGGELGMQGRFTEDQLDYSNPDVRGVFGQYADWDTAALRREIKKVRKADHGRWPWWVRMELRRGGAGACTRCICPLPLRKAVIVSVNGVSARLGLTRVSRNGPGGG